MKRAITQIFTLLLLITLAVPAFAGKVLAEIEYFYSDDGTLIGKAFNGKRVNFEYDLRGQLLAVTDASGNDLERYTYDPAGNRLSKTINGVTTTYSYDEANQLIRSTVNGEITYYEYDAAGRMIQTGDKSYIYNGNNKVIEVRQNGKTIAKFEYNIDGQIAKAIYGDKKEEFIWDGLALIWRSGVTYINEPYVTGGNPVMAGDDVLFNDMLGSTLAVNDKAVEMTSFGETDNENAFFTGKPMIDELGYSFLFRDYNPNQGKWTTVDPLGYPDGWNNLAYCGNGVTSAVDLWGCATVTSTILERGTPTQPNAGGETGWRAVVSDVNMTMRSISVEVVVTVAFAQNLKDSSQFAKGDIARYTPHSGLSGGVITIVSLNPDGTCVREAVVAHEYGHVNYATRTICAYLRSSLSLLEASWNVNQWWSEVKVRHEIDAIIKTVEINSMIGFWNAANDPTIAWFQSSLEWRFVHDDKKAGYWEWEKE